MSRSTLLLVVIAVLAMFVTLGLQGCGLFGGGGDETADAGAEGAPPEGMDGMPAEPGEVPADGMGGPPPDMPADGAPADMPMDMPADGAAAGGGDAGTLVAEGMAAKHDGDYVTARSKFEAAIAADPNNADAHYGLAWVLAEMAASGQPNLKQNAIAEFERFLELGGNQQQVAEATSALDRLR